MKSIVFSMASMHLHGSAFYEFLRLRKRFFVDNLEWDIPTDGVVEMDQYDTPLAHYSLVVDEGKIIGGARCQPTVANWGIYSCMIRDASEGLLHDIPSDLFRPEMAAPKVWEGTRLVVSDEVGSVALRTRVLALVIDGLMRIIEAQGGTSMLTLSPTALHRTTKLVGLKATQVSRPYVSGSDNREYALFESKVERAIPELERFGINTKTFSFSEDPTSTPSTQEGVLEPRQGSTTYQDVPRVSSGGRKG